MDASADMNAAAPVATAAATKARTRQKVSVRFPYQSHCSITGPMKRSIERMADKLCLDEADIHRMALIIYLNSNDPEFSGDRNGA
jgi:hypothetical protein